MPRKLMPKGGLLKNAFILISGTGLAQAIPLLFSPVLTRIFSPEDFGRLAFFMACSSIVALLATGLYELAIVLPKKDIEAFNLMGLIAFIAFIVSLLSFVVVITYGYFFDGFLNNAKTGDYLLLLPFGIFFTASFQAITYWLNRKKQYKIINVAKISQSLITVLVSIFFGYYGFKKYGLIFGFVAGLFVASIPFYYLLIIKKRLLLYAYLSQAAKKYINYPKLMLPSSIMNTTASQAPIFFINKFYNQSVVGSYSFAFRILTAPVAIVSVAIGQLYYKKIADIVNAGNKKILPEFKQTAKLLSIVSVCMFLPLFFFGEEIFSFVFGSNWIIAGRYIQILALAVLVRFIVSPLSTVFYAVDKLKTLAVWQTTYFCTTIILFLIGTKHPIITLLWMYVIHEMILYSIYFGLMLMEIKKHDNSK